MVQSETSRIYIIEDDERLQRMIGLTLRGEPFDCLYFGTALTAIEAIGKDKPDLIIVDFRLPDMHGIDLLQQARDQGYEGPVLFSTAMSKHEPEVAEVIETLGEGSILLKPFDPDELLRRIEILLREGNTPAQDAD